MLSLSSYMHYLTDLQPLKTGASAVYQYTLGLEALFTVKPKYDEPFSMAVRKGNMLYVPRECVPIGIEDMRVEKPRAAINCKRPPRSQEQADLIAESVALLLSGQNHIFEAPTGFGKSYCGAAIAAEVGQPTLIVVTKQDLMESWRSTLINLIGVPPEQIGHLQAGVKKWEGCRFVLGMVHSLVIPDKYEPEVFQHFGMVIFDEVHRMAADAFALACTLFPAKYRLGLSATPDRPDGKFPVVHAHIGRVLVKGKTVPMKPKVLVKKTGWKIPKVKRFDKGVYIMKTLEHAPGRMAGVSKAMGASHERNAIITDFTLSAYQSGRNILIMSDLVEGHLVPLFHALGKAGVPAEDIDYYIGGRSKIELEIASKKRVVLTTYAMCSEGTDCPWWDTLVMINPRSNVKQAIGRIMRVLDGKKQPVVLDLVDSDSIFSAFYSKREVQYFSVGAEIVKL